MADIASIKRQLNERGFLRYMAPPLCEEALCEIEAAYGIALPPDYRSFLQEIGNGGPGPDYGLLPFGKALDYDNKLWGAAVPKDHLRHPFPHMETYDPEKDQQADYDAADDENLTDEELGLRILGHYRGLLGLAHEGCGRYHVLVVTGPARGAVWMDCTDSRGPFIPMESGFLDWYQNWLDAKYSTMWKPRDFIAQKQKRPSWIRRFLGLQAEG